MPKRKEPQVTEDVAMKGADSGSDSEDLDIVNVSFEMFDPQPTYDFHGLKTLLRQLFDVDSTLLDLSSLTTLILSQPLLGTTVKVDGNESDPYAFLTVLNMNEHREVPVVGELRSYLLGRTRGVQGGMYGRLKGLLGEEGEGGKEGVLGLILTERLVNLPTEIVPPMYKMLLEEINWAVEDNEPYNFTHFLILSKTYTEIPSKLDDADTPRPTKKGKKAGGSSSKAAKAKKELFYFHPEDEILQRKADAWESFKYVNEQDERAADSRRAFQSVGIMPQGHLILVGKEELEGVVGDLEGMFRA